MTLRLAFAALAIAAGLALPALAQETRTIVDDTGVEVTFPATPMRIVTLHDSQLTIPLIELGVMPAGSHGRVNEVAGTPFLRSGMILAGVDFANAPIEWVGDYPADIEKVAAAEPDLIITTEWQQLPPEQLRQIAPTIVIDSTKRSRDEIYEFLADIAGPSAQAQLERLKARYQAQIDQIKLVVEDPSSITVSTFQVYEGTIYGYHTFGNLGRVLRDAGFSQPAIIDTIPENDYSEFSLEALPEFDGDVIFATYNTGWGNDLPNERASYETTFPGFCQQMFACREGQMYYIPRDEAASTSFDALGMTAYAVLSILGGQDIVTRSE
jgi:iron complex transport system substrate-binding protein